LLPLTRVGLARQIGWTHFGAGKGRCDLPLQRCKAVRLHQTAPVEGLDKPLYIPSEQKLSAELPGKSILDIGDIIRPIQMAGDKKSWWREQHLFFNHPFWITEANKALPILINRKRVERSDCW
jgi:hypothetical protein